RVGARVREPEGEQEQTDANAERSRFGAQNRERASGAETVCAGPAGCQAGRLELEGDAPGDQILIEVERIEVGIAAREQILEAHPKPGLNGVFRLRARTEERVAAPVGHAAHRLLRRVIVDAASDTTADAELLEDR